MRKILSVGAICFSISVASSACADDWKTFHTSECWPRSSSCKIHSRINQSDLKKDENITFGSVEYRKVTTLLNLHTSTEQVEADCSKKKISFSHEEMDGPLTYAYRNDGEWWSDGDLERGYREQIVLDEFPDRIMPTPEEKDQKHETLFSIMCGN